MKAVKLVRLLAIPLIAAVIVLFGAAGVDSEPGRAGQPATRSKQTRKAEPKNVIEQAGVLTLVISLGLIGGLVAHGWRRPRA